MTTDTVPKQVVVAGDGFTVGGMAKGAAMLAPDMATMLAVLHHRCRRRRRELQAGAPRRRSRRSFNTMTVDGCTSTNDTVLVLASGLGVEPVAAVADGRARPRPAGRWPSRWWTTPRARPRSSHIRVRGAASDDAAHVGGPQGRRLHAGPVLAQRRGPLLGPRRVRARLGRHAFDIDRRARSPTAAPWSAPAGSACRTTRRRWPPTWPGATSCSTATSASATGEAVVLGTDLGYGYIDENRTTS